MNTFDKILISIAAIFGIFAVWAFIGVYHSVVLQKKCLENGYSSSNVTYDYEGFCMKRGQYGETIIIKEKDLK